ncbi:uncharacterized protein LOC141785613 isoform X2 [Halichoeres trimaculatus]|uniref:uncharacterized protein LOC141785613 isoform X2 n=1 Tax=Halichoeres trimaculatus TaxID=147232 RepID=UPI003D9EE9A1
MSKLRARHANCSVIDCKIQHKILYSVPAPEIQRRQWQLFIFNNNVPDTVSTHLFVCANHFTPDCFNNWGQYKAGFASTLTLIRGSLPTVREPATTGMTLTTSSQPISAASHHRQQDSPAHSELCMDNEPISSEEHTTTHIKTESSDMPVTTYVKTESSNMASSQQFSATHITTQQGNVTLLISPKRTVSGGTQCSSTSSFQSVGTQLPYGALYSRAKATVATQFSQLMLSIGTQCFSTVTSKSAATQLSKGTLTHFRSKGTQANLCCSSVFNETSQRDRGPTRSSPPKKASSSIMEARPAKRPRLEIKEEEEDEEIMAPISPSEIRQMEASCQHNEPKYIVFESCLRALFETCPLCMQDCEVQQQRLGTYVSFSQRCPDCLYSRTWQSQPIRGSTPVGDLQMSAAVYFTGGSFPQVKKVCKAMNLQMFTKDSFNRNVRMFIEPAIIHKWKNDQQTLIQDLRLQNKVAVGGFIKTDPPGRATKFSSCSLMSLETKHIIDVQLEQSCGSSESSNMEKEALRRGLNLSDSNHLNVDYVVTDCNAQVQEYLKERNVTHYYDVCHFEKGLSRKLKALAKKRRFKAVRKWLPSIKKHIYYTARSSQSGPEKVAKWKSLLNCFQNIHKHDEPCFPRCAHSDEFSTDSSKWLQPGSDTLHRVEKVVMNEQVLRNVENLSHEPQTSLMEDFHRDVLHFAPKKENAPFIEKLCRLYLAAMHFNENVEQKLEATSEEKAVNKNMFQQSGSRKLAPKHLKTAPTCSYIRDLMTLLFEEVLEDPRIYTEELKQIPIPEDSHTLLETPS